MDGTERTKQALTGLVCELSSLKEEQETMRVTRETEYIEELAEAERMGNIVAGLRTEVSRPMCACVCVGMCVLHSCKHACVCVCMHE